MIIHHVCSIVIYVHCTLQGIDIREMLAGASLMDDANRTTVVRNWLNLSFTRWHISIILMFG